MSEVEEVVPEVAKEEEAQENIGVLIAKLGGPGPAEIEAWKTQYKDVLVSAFSKDEIYIWRELKRHEYRKLQLDLASPEKKMDNFDYEEAICIVCTLWPKLTAGSFADTKGGTATSLAEQIMQNSNFFSPQQAAAFVMKL